MISKRELFLNHVGQTGPAPIAIDVSHAKGMYIYDNSGKRYIDMNSGISVSSLGHCHPAVVKAIQNQSETFMHTMVYGEHLQSPQVNFANLLSQQLDERLSSIYYVMSGTEATEGAMKLAKRVTGRTEIIACSNAYHGSTQGAESLRSDEDYKQAFYPLLPGIKHIRFNEIEDLEKISDNTACVILEPIQAEAGVILPSNNYLQAVREQCSKTGALMILDEIQTGFGRTGKLFAHQKYGFIPDMMLVGKAMGGGMPIAGFISSLDIMSCLTKNPMLGHITTFGGHPVSCAAAEACLQTLLDDRIVENVEHKGKMLKQILEAHPIVKEVRQSGLMLAVEMEKRKYLKHVINESMKQGLIIDYFLFNNKSFRLAPPLIISDDQINAASGVFLSVFDYAAAQYK